MIGGERMSDGGTTSWKKLRTSLDLTSSSDSNRNNGSNNGNNSMNVNSDANHTGSAQSMTSTTTSKKSGGMKQVITSVMHKYASQANFWRVSYPNESLLDLNECEPTMVSRRRRQLISLEEMNHIHAKIPQMLRL